MRFVPMSVSLDYCAAQVGNISRVTIDPSENIAT